MCPSRTRSRCLHRLRVISSKQPHHSSYCHILGTRHVCFVLHVSKPKSSCSIFLAMTANKLQHFLTDLLVFIFHDKNEPSFVYIIIEGCCLKRLSPTLVCKPDSTDSKNPFACRLLVIGSTRIRQDGGGKSERLGTRGITRGNAPTMRVINIVSTY